MKTVSALSRAIAKRVILLLALFMLIGGGGGCGGGSKGTGVGSSSAEGRLVRAATSEPIAGAIVRVVETGEETTTGVRGEFFFAAVPVGGTLEFVVEVEGIVSSFVTREIAENVTSFFIELILNEDGSLDGTVRDTSGGSPPVSREPTPIPTRTPGPSPERPNPEQPNPEQPNPEQPNPEQPDPTISPPPPAPILNSLPALVRSAMLTVSGIKAAGTGIEVNSTLFLQADISTSFSFEISLSEGLNTLSFVAIDEGQRRSSSVHVAVRLDSTAPEFTNLSAHGLTESSAEISLGSNETTRFSYVLSSGTASEYGEVSSVLVDHSLSLTNLMPGTNYRFSVILEDEAGNLSTEQAITFDTVAQPPQPGQSQLVWTDMGRNELSRIPISANQQTAAAALSVSQQPEQLVQGIGYPEVLLIDNDSRKLYWTDPWAMTIESSNLDGTGVKEIYNLPSNEGIPRSLAIYGGRLYYFSYLSIRDPNNSIRTINLDGSDMRALPIDGIPMVSSLQVNPTDNKLYWIEIDRIRRSNADGSSVEQLYQTPGQLGISALVLDAAAGKMYWFDFNGWHIRRANLDGSAMETLIDLGPPLYSAVGTMVLNPAEGKLYWVDHRRFYRANLDGTGLELIKQKPSSLYSGLAIDHLSGKIYTSGQGIFQQKLQRMNLDGSSLESIDYSMVTKPESIIADNRNKHLIWRDSDTDAIYRTSFDGSQLELLARTNNDAVHGSGGMALDLDRGKIYWDDYTVGFSPLIRRANLDGSAAEDLFALTGSETLHDLAFDPLEQKIYWGRMGIHRADLDGSNQEVLVSIPVDNIYIDIAPSTRKLYWVETAAGRLGRSDLDGSGRQILIDSGLLQPVGITIDEDGSKIYWTEQTADGSRRRIRRADLDGGNLEDFVVDFVTQPWALAIQRN